jgi:hypothetical protein
MFARLERQRERSHGGRERNPRSGGTPSYVPLTLQRLGGPQSAQAKPKHSLGEALCQTLRGTPPDDERRRLLQKDVDARKRVSPERENCLDFHDKATDLRGRARCSSRRSSCSCLHARVPPFRRKARRLILPEARSLLMSGARSAGGSARGEVTSRASVRECPCLQKQQPPTFRMRSDPRSGCTGSFPTGSPSRARPRR